MIGCHLDRPPRTLTCSTWDVGHGAADVIIGIFHMLTPDTLLCAPRILKGTCKVFDKVASRLQAVSNAKLLHVIISSAVVHLPYYVHVLAHLRKLACVLIVVGQSA